MLQTVYVRPKSKLNHANIGNKGHIFQICGQNWPSRPFSRPKGQKSICFIKSGGYLHLLSTSFHVRKVVNKAIWTAMEWLKYWTKATDSKFKSKIDLQYHFFLAKRPKIQLPENNQIMVVLMKFHNLVFTTKFIRTSAIWTSIPESEKSLSLPNSPPQVS